MTWAKVDDQFFQHPKALAAGPLACLLYVGGLTYANRFLTDGHIPQSALRVLVPNLARVDVLAAHLVKVKLWEVVDAGWQIHDFARWNEPASEVKARREVEREASRKRVAAWRARQKDREKVGEPPTSNADGNTVTETVTERSRTGSPTPTPTPTPVTTESTPTPSAAEAASVSAAPIKAEILNGNGHHPENGKPKNLKRREAESPAFCAFMAEYPRPENRKRAREVWQAMKLDAEADTVMAGLARWKLSASWAQRPLDKYPHPTTWLRGECWKEFPAPTSGLSPKTEGNIAAGHRFIAKLHRGAV